MSSKSREVFSIQHYDKKFVTDRWFSPEIHVSSNNKTDCHAMGDILLKVALNTIAKSFMFTWVYMNYILVLCLRKDCTPLLIQHIL